MRVFSPARCGRYPGEPTVYWFPPTGGVHNWRGRFMFSQQGSQLSCPKYPDTPYFRPGPEVHDLIDTRGLVYLVKTTKTGTVSTTLFHG